MSKEESLKEGWYLLKTRPRQEMRAEENLDVQGFDVYNPQVKQCSKGVTKEEALFPGYVFLFLDLDDRDRYHKIRSTRGVTEIVYFNRITRQLHKDGRLSKELEKNVHDLLPKPIPNGGEIIKDIKQIVEVLNNKAEGITSRLKPGDFKPGDKVIIDSPLYQGLEMTFLHNMAKERGMILIQHIKQQRSSCGKTEKKVLNEKKMKVNLGDLEKA